jgi:hypothetical protein
LYSPILISVCLRLLYVCLRSLLGLGYKLEQIVEAAEETRRIRKNRLASMKGSPWDKFKAVFDRTNGTVRRTIVKTPEPHIVAAKTG